MLAGMADAAQPQRARSLNVHAATFVPQSKSCDALDSQASAPAVIDGDNVVEKHLPKVQTSRSGVYKSLDTVPFTPGQGICTPSPTNMAAYWYQARYLGYDPYSGFPAVWSPMQQQQQYAVQTSPASPMYGASSLASAGSLFYMSQSSGSPGMAYLPHWQWPYGPSPPQAVPFMQSHASSSGSPRGSSASGGSPMSPIAVYSPTAAAAAAGMNGHSFYTLPQAVPFSQGVRPSQTYPYGGIWQQQQNYVYGQPMRAYRSPTRTPSRSPPQASSNMNTGSSSPRHRQQHSSLGKEAGGIQSSSHNGMSDSSDMGHASGSSQAAPLTPPQADATVNVRVQRSFLSAAKHGRSSPGIVHKSPSGMKDSPGQSVAYSASSEDAGSTSGRGQADEASSVEVFEELCGAWKAHGSLQDAPRQLVDLAELMQTYGFPTPGWGSKGPIGHAASPPQGFRRQTSGHSASLQIPGSSPYKLNARQRRTLRRALDRARQAVVG